MSAPSVLIIGAGMYVCGRGTAGVGTILPTLVRAQADGTIGQIAVAATSQGSVATLREKLAEVNRRLGTRVAVRGYPAHGVQEPAAYRQALAELSRPACAIVAVPDHLHARIASEVIEAGVHVLVVKPLAPTLAQARQLVALAQAHQVYGAVDFHKRFDEANLLARQMLTDGRLGALRHISVEFSQRRGVQEAFASWIQQTNIFQYLGVHYVDLIHFLTGAYPVRVLATGQPREAIQDGVWRLDAIQATVEWKDPAGGSFVSTIATNWIEPNASSAMSRQTIRLLGTRGRCDSDQTDRGVRLVTEAGLEDVNPYFSQLYQAADGLPVVEGYGPACIRRFLADVQGLCERTCRMEDLAACRPSFQEALVSTAVIDAVSRSLAQGEEWVAVEQTSWKPPARRRRATGVGRARRKEAAVKR